MGALGEIERDIVKPDVTILSDYSGSLRLARIVEVYDASCLGKSSKEGSRYGKVRVIWLDGVGYVPQDLVITKSWFSWKRGAAIIAMPEIDDIVVCLSRPGGYPVILGFLPLKWDVASNKIVSVSDDTVGKIKPLYKGEILIKSSSQGEILLSKDGSIKISAFDPTDVSKVVTNLNGNCTEQIFNRVKNDRKLVECTIGYDFLDSDTVKPAGIAPQVFSAGTNVQSRIDLTFPYEDELSFFLYDDRVLESINSIIISKDSNKSSGSEEISSNRYSLKVTPIYTPSSADASTETIAPCTAEKNSYLYTIKFDDTLTYNSSYIVSINMTVTQFIGGIRLNSFGDVFIDGRNVVIRSKEGKSSAKFSDDGQTSIRGISTTVGNTYEGSILCDSSGVKSYKGIFVGSSVEEESTSSIINSDASYFYISDYYPLIKLYKEFSTWKLDGVTKEEYSKLTDTQKVSIDKMWVSPKEDSSAPTQSFLTGLIKKGFPSYAELKSLV